MHLHVQALPSQNKSTQELFQIFMRFKVAGEAVRLYGACILLCWVFPPLHVDMRQTGYKSNPSWSHRHAYFFFTTLFNYAATPVRPCPFPHTGWTLICKSFLTAGQLSVNITRKETLSSVREKHLGLTQGPHNDRTPRRTVERKHSIHNKEGEGG